MSEKQQKLKFSDIVGGDRSLWMIIIFLCIASILVIYSSTASMAYRKLDGDTSYYLRRQIQFVVTGLIIIFAFHRVSYKYYFKHAKKIFYLSLIPLVLTFTNGAEYNDTARWLNIPYTGMTFQPSDLVKITLVMMLAFQLAIRQNIIDRISILPSLSYSSWKKDPERNSSIFFRTTMPLIFPIFISTVMILITNLSTALIIGATSVIVLIIGRVRIKEIFRLMMLAIVCLAIIIVILKIAGVGRVDTWQSRIENFIGINDTPIDGKTDSKEDKDEFQKHQAQISVAAGWLGGVGPGNSTQRSNLPHPYSDYAYAFIIEEYGILGAVLILACYIGIFIRAINIFKRCETAFPALLVLGLSLTTTLQAMLHMAVSVNAGPVTGQTLPLISLGGSSLMFTCMSLGIILSISREQNEIADIKLLDDKRKLVLDEWDQVEIDEKAKWKGVLLADNDEEALEMKNNDQMYNESFDGTFNSSEELDMNLQKGRLEKALEEEKYQPVIWDEKIKKQQNLK